MNVGELKKLIAGVPDDIPVMLADSNEFAFWLMEMEEEDVADETLRLTNAEWASDRWYPDGKGEKKRILRIGIMEALC